MLPVKRPSTRRVSSSRPTSLRPTGEKPKKNNATPLEYMVDDPSSFKISDNLADSCKTHCKICGEAFFLNTMRSHTMKAHGIQITRYKEMYGPFDIIEKVFHKCHLCGKSVLMDSDTLGSHIKGTHNMKEKIYKEKYCINKPITGVKKVSVINKSKVMKDEEEPPISFADKTSLVSNLAKLEKEHSEKNVNNEVLKVSCSDQETANLLDENLLKGDKDPYKSFLNDNLIGEDVMSMGLEEEGMDVELEEYLDAMEKHEFFNMTP